MIRKFFPVLLVFLSVCGFSSDKNIEKVFIVFKTHLDVGFTDLPSKVTQTYKTRFIPQAIRLSEKLRKEGGNERYVWTTGSWLIWEYLRTAAPEEKQKLETAILNGDIVWNALPYTVESETMTAEHYRALLVLSRQLDRKYGKKTIAAKQTDVPGHTRSIVPLLADAGIQFLHIGVNPASPVPDVPSVCLWKDETGQKEIILMYQNEYGKEEILPDGKTVLSVQFTSDNRGPHSYTQVKQIFSTLRLKYPNAEIKATSLNEVAAELIKMKDSLPTVTSEIGDTWIHGYASAPNRMARFRALSRLASSWYKTGKLNEESEEGLAFALSLGLIAEHTWGIDVKVHLGNWHLYDPVPFSRARAQGRFRLAEESWKELDAYIDRAVACLPEELQKEAETLLAKYNTAAPAGLPETAPVASETDPVLDGFPLFSGQLNLKGTHYRCYDGKEVDDFLNRYNRFKIWWVKADFGKPGLRFLSKAESLSLPARIIGQTRNETENAVETNFDLTYAADSDSAVLLPRKVSLNIKEQKDGKRADITLSLYGKPAVRYPEGYWLTFDTADAARITAEKTGEPVNLSDVVKRGARHEHGIDRYVEIQNQNGTFRIYSEEAFLINLGKDPGYNYTTEEPDIRNGLHFNLLNNLWGTNFSMWIEGNLTYHWTVVKCD